MIHLWSKSGLYYILYALSDMRKVTATAFMNCGGDGGGKKTDSSNKAASDEFNFVDINRYWFRDESEDVM